MSTLMHSINIMVTAFERAQILFWLTGIVIDTESWLKRGFSISKEKAGDSTKKGLYLQMDLYLYPIMDLTSA